MLRIILLLFLAGCAGWMQKETKLNSCSTEEQVQEALGKPIQIKRLAWLWLTLPNQEDELLLPCIKYIYSGRLCRQAQIDYEPTPMFLYAKDCAIYFCCQQEDKCGKMYTHYKQIDSQYYDRTTNKSCLIEK